MIPKTSATIAEVLKDYGYSTAAFGKWHNTPATETTAMGPFDRWPTGYGFEHFYGFLAGETSQWEPRLVENTNMIEPPHDPDYHLTRDLADQAITWLRQHRSFAPDKPFLMYWAPGAGHGPHQIFKENADAYAGKFDDGWDAMRERVYARQKALGWIPADTDLNSRPEGILPWDAIPQDQRAFQTRLMEVFAGFVEDADVQAGRIMARTGPPRTARQHAGLLHLRRQRGVGRGPERHDQRASGAEQHSQHGRTADRGAGGARWPRRARIGPHGQHVQRRLRLGREHAVPVTPS